ncbi:MAG: lipase family protein [Pseudomonadales bacterium]|nr:lipase family protein [Pseudomonadales bacterium]
MNVARVLLAAEYRIDEIPAALSQTFRLSRTDATRLVESARSTPARVEQTVPFQPGTPVTTCVRPDGTLFICPAGSPITGGRVASPDLAPGGINWTGTILTPANDAEAGSTLLIQPPPGAALPPVALTLAGTPLTILSAAPQEVRVQLPAQTLRGALAMTNLDNNLSGTLAADYRVRKTGPLDLLETNTTVHSWTNSYLLAVLTHLIYRDALGSTSTHPNDFRALMSDWGMDTVHYVSIPELHLLAAVLIGPRAVVVVFRGSELQTTAHCLMTMVLPQLCANLPPNWITNLAHVPLRQRPEWGDNVRTHMGFDAAVDALYNGILAHVEPALGADRRLLITGHSLGAAMATLFAFRVAVEAELPIQGVYTYGSPRVGNVPFAQEYTAKLGAITQRWQNRADPAPAVPPGHPSHLAPPPPPASWSIYQHVGRLNFLAQNGPPQVGLGAEPFQPPTITAPLPIGDHAMGAGADSYTQRMHPWLPEAVKALVPPPP